MAAIVITKENFNEVVLKSDKPVLVDFYATWCGPCKMQLPIVDSLAKELEGKAVIGKIDVDQEGELAQLFNVRSIPTLVAFKNGKVTKSGLGFHPKDRLIEMLGL